jgi:hypothetical protein
MGQLSWAPDGCRLRPSAGVVGPGGAHSNLGNNKWTASSRSHVLLVIVDDRMRDAPAVSLSSCRDGAQLRLPILPRTDRSSDAIEHVVTTHQQLISNRFLRQSHAVN